MTVTVITSILALIQSIIPSLGITANGAALIAQIIATLEQILPLLLSFIPTFYTSVKNIIAALQADPSTTATQLTALQALDAQVDAAFELAAQAVDPDAPAPTTP